MSAAGRPPYDDVSLRAARQVVDALRASDLPRAYDLSDKAIVQGLLHPALFNARALWWEANGRIEEALADFERTRVYVPDDANLLISIGQCHLKLGHALEAVSAFEASNTLKPASAIVHRLWAEALETSGDLDAATRAYERAIAIDPTDAMTFARLAALCLRRHDVKYAREYATKSLALYPGNAAATLCLSNVEVIDGEFDLAERRLRAALTLGLDSSQRATALSILGDAFDGSNKVAEAFAAYSASKVELRRVYAAQFARGRAIDAANALISHFGPMASVRWNPVDVSLRMPGEPREHVFLLGFMRSGTTLLELALASHPDVVVMDEHDVLREANQTFLTSPEGIERLADLAPEEIGNWRDAYWNSVRQHGIAPEHKVFVDKLPFHTAKLPIIAKLFPRAKILFCLRDPRDVVFSSFRRPFEVNATIFEFLSLEDGARFYSAIMQLAAIYRRKLPLAVHEHRYEGMIENFKDSLTALCDFIGIGWSESMRAFRETAQTTDIRNPSAAQVRRPLNSEGIGQWRRYGEHIAPILPVLAPWVAAFGYPPDSLPPKRE